MKNILILIALVFAWGSQAGEISCPVDTKTMVECSADYPITKVIVCLDKTGDMALAYQSPTGMSGFSRVREIARGNSVGYVGTGVSLLVTVYSGKLTIGTSVQPLVCN